MSIVDWCKVYERPAIRFKEKPEGLSSKINNIQNTQKWSFPLRICLINVSKSAVLCGYVHMWWKHS